MPLDDPHSGLDDELRQAIVAALQPGETLQTFIQAAIERHLAQRVRQQAFVQRAIVSGEGAQRTGRYVAAEEVLARLHGLLAAASARPR